MKKLIPLLSLTLFIGLLSSCIFLPGGYSDNTTPRYTMFFDNASTNQFIYDWYLKDTNNTNYVKSKNELYPVAPGKTAKISGLKTNLYQVWFCVFTSSTNDVYLHTENYVDFDSDTTFELKDGGEYSFIEGAPRNATPETSNNITDLVLIDSNGKRYPLVKETIYK